MKLISQQWEAIDEPNLFALREGVINPKDYANRETPISNMQNYIFLQINNKIKSQIIKHLVVYIDDFGNLYDPH